MEWEAKTLLALAFGVFLSLAPAVSASCKTEISDPPRSPRHTLTAGQRDLVLERLKAEIPLDVSGPRDEAWKYEFTDVVLHAGVVTVTLTVRDVGAGEQYQGQTCVAGGFGSVRLLINDRGDACQLEKRFLVTVKDCLEQYEAGKVPLSGMPVPVSK
jgi:hypothetical protein